ncbi:MAG: methionine--tRNA ligase [Acidimicrobiia bacterium]
MKFFLTTAIDFVNSKPHLGTAYEKITADVIARYRRLAGFETHFLMGNDEHSQNVFKKAAEQGRDPLAYCDEMEGVFRDVWKRLDLSFDDFIRTTDRKRHFPAVQKMAQACLDNGDIYEGAYEGWYCEGCESFKPEKDLVEGLCPIHKTRPQWIKEKNWFFRLSKYQQPLLKHYADHPSFIEPEIRRNEILRLVEGGLEDISMSRAGQSWGLPVPFDPTSVVYVWFDALINYAAADGYGWDDEQFAKWWPANLHVVGKDITRFHCVIWPAMLMSAGLPLPQQVFGHGWVYFKGERMSKTMGNIVDPLDAANRFGPDPLRLYLTKEIPYGGDGDFTWERFEEKYNADLANNLGNLVNRVASMSERYQQGRVRPQATSGALAAIADRAVHDYRAGMQVHALHEGAAAAFGLISAANNFIAEKEPWKLAKSPDNAAELNGVLWDLSEAVRIAATLLLPIMPASSTEILRRLGDDRPIKDWRLDSDASWRTSGEKQILNAGALWPRIEAEKGVVHVIEESQTPAEPVTQAPSAAPAAPATITNDDFAKVHLKVARVLEAEKMPKSQKLLKLKVDAGEAEPRTILAGIAESYEPEQMVGKSIVIVANLAPRKMMGIESNGMVLAASPDDGKAIVLNSDPAAPGTRVR